MTERPRLAARLAGASLLLGGLAFNPLALAHFFAEPPLGTEGVIALQIALIVSGGWLVWRGPRLPLIPLALIAVALGALALLGGYGTARSLQKVQDRNRLLATIDRSEQVQQHLSGEVLPLLALGIAAPARSLFADTVVVADVEQIAEATEVVPALGIKRQRWEIAPAEPVYDDVIALWGPLWAALDWHDYAAFHLETGHFLDAEAAIYQARLRFDAAAQTKGGERAQIRAGLVLEWQQQDDATWRIQRWETESLEMLTQPHTLFAAARDEVLPAQARVSRHAALVLQSFRDSAFIAPHRYFTRQAFDRHPGVSVVDIDADGYDDLYLAVRQGRNMLLHNGGDGTFTERAAQYGLDVEHHTAAALFADFDNDGDPDVFLGRTLAPSRYLVNENGCFAPRDLGADVLPFLVASISAADYDRDGLLDVYFSTYAARMVLDAVSTAPRGAPWGGALLADFLPADRARALYDLSRDRIGRLIHDAPGPPNVLLRNLGNGRFAPTVAGWRNTLQATWADYDRDGDPDLYLANDFATNNLLRNDGGALVDVTAESGAADLGFGMGASWADYDGDGRQDLYVTNMHSSAGRRITAAAGPAGAAFAPLARGSSLLRNSRAGFVRVADSPVEDGGWGWGGQFLDFDNDGDLDIYAPSGYYTPPAAVALPEDT